MRRALCCSRDRAQRNGWWIVLVAFTADALSLGGRGLFSVAMLFFEVEWGWSRSTSSSLMSVVHVCNGLTTLLSGHLADVCPASYAMGGGIVFLALAYGLVAAMAYE